ncbi:MAG: hypothetical protein U9N49_12855 [Campylobacterota bacterium]|nr:hypothetical protein [Campylobacterota bacterium]
MKKFGKISLLLFTLYWLPFMVILIEYRPYKSIKALPLSDAVIVFGTLVRDKKVSPLLQERLDASIAI